MSAPAPHAALSRPYMTVDVFTHTALLGNPVAVVLGADGLSDAVVGHGHPCKARRIYQQRLAYHDTQRRRA